MLSHAPRVEWPTSPPGMPIPDRLNTVLVIGVVSAAIGLLYFASHVGQVWAMIAVGIVFSYVMLTGYALLHEATHGNLHSSPRWNYWLGVAAGAFFPVPFSMVRTTHQGHHLRNRTDFEMFDLYYPGDNRLMKYAQWYSILCGLFWPIVPLGAALTALWPGLLQLRPFQRARSSSYLVGDIRASDLWAIRGEVVLIVATFAALSYLLELRWIPSLVLYGCFAVNWSTRQYVGHAFSQRHVIDGAWNLKHNRVMSWLLLHGEYDLNHHRRPDVPWFYLPALSPRDESRVSYFRQYWRLWRGPRLNAEPAPEALADLPLSVHR